MVVIVMTTRTVERHRTKCGQYWPELEGTNVTCGVYNIQSENIENCGQFWSLGRILLWPVDKVSKLVLQPVNSEYSSGSRQAVLQPKTGCWCSGKAQMPDD